MSRNGVHELQKAYFYAALVLVGLMRLITMDYVYIWTVL